MHHHITQWMSDIRAYTHCPSVLHWVHSLVAKTRTLAASMVTAKSLVSLRLLVACCWQSGWEHFSSNNQQAVADRPTTKMQLFFCALVTMAISSIILFCSFNQSAMFFKYTFQQTTKLWRKIPMISVYYRKYSVPHEESRKLVFGHFDHSIQNQVSYEK